ncbi:mandelate racemase/muconate lactonizing enzyme family protein [Pigmentiphaga soli]|uniref:Mandelate racemase/muconate lactonizing enzyme family protein n=1 Tax=Pigmentiphaga soli TaxID=1007095 RepID=A0ABP8GKU0_9BURK
MPHTIRRIELTRVSVPFETNGPRNGLRPGLAPWTRIESLLVRVHTADGAAGWGEAFGHFVNAGTAAVLESLVAPWFIGKDAHAIGALMEQAERAFYGFGRNGPVRYALSAIDVALWDIAAQRAGLPLYRLLGGNRPEVGRYASFARYGDPDAVAANTAGAAAAGFAQVKLHEATLPAFLAARQAAGDRTRVALDVNCPWTVDEARAMARRIAPEDFEWLEEPVWPPEDYDAMARVRREGTPIAAGENVTTLHDFKRLFEAGAVDVVQPSVIKAGGITAVRKVYALAESYSVRVAPHCYFWGPGYLATAHLIAADPRPMLLETPYITLQEPIHPAFDSQSGRMELPDTAGLGFAPDEAALARHTAWSAAVS